MKVLTKKKRLELLSTVFLRDYAYAYGAKGLDNKLTSDKLDQLARNSPSTYTASYKAKTAKNIGKRVIDCSGLVCAVWEISDIGSYQLADLPKTQPTEYQEVSLSSLLWGDCVWKTGHVGIYIGDNKVLEAKGVDAGIRISKLSDTKWRKAIRKKTLHYYGRTGWILDDTGWWFAYGESKGEYYKSCIVDADDTGVYYSFDQIGYANKYL